MKKVLCAVLLSVFVSGIASAGPELRKNCGCGIGSMLFENNEGLMSQTAAATTNGLFGNQTFGISSGTLDCKQPAQFYGREMLHRFVAENMDNLAKDIARGHGESLDTLAILLNIPAEQRTDFNTRLQANFAHIFTSPQVTEVEVVNHIIAVTAT